MALKFATIAAATTLALGAAPAFAAKPVPVAQPSLGNCANTYGTVVSGATACSGMYTGNVFSSNAGDLLTQEAAVAALGGSFDKNFGTLFGFGSLSDGSTGPRTIDFGATFYGLTIIGAHFGGGNSVIPNQSVFWTFDFGKSGASSLTFLQGKALSNLYVYSDPGAVPEPATWALMILGFGAVGSVLRRSKKTKLALTYA